MDFRKLKYYRHNSLILVASSDQQLLSTISEVAAAEKYNCTIAHDGECAWQLILQMKPAIILADWTMPDVSGLALCHRTKSNLERPDLVAIYFILIVEAFNYRQRQIGFETGVDEFIGNPIDPSELRTRLRAGLRASALMQSLTWTNQRLLAQNDLLEALALSDPLTKVLSKEAFAKVIPKMTNQFRGYGSYKSYSCLSILIINIDRFHETVQDYGESIGDEAIKAIAGRLAHSCMANSLIYRYGLNEFVCVTPHHDTSDSESLANSLLASIRSHPIAVSSGLLFPLTISIGAVVISLESHDLDNLDSDSSFSKLVSFAEKSLERSQKAGGDRAFIERL
ncbi:MAG: hypothetical protein DCE90_08645 [Pseudanabaena sp.]|nr:MAG: hypothetical protein DCE90_08645 [Pseudanabaena sp.]